MRIFHPLEVLYVSEVGENLDKITRGEKGLIVTFQHHMAHFE